LKSCDTFLKTPAWLNSLA